MLMRNTLTWYKSTQSSDANARTDSGKLFKTDAAVAGKER